MKCSHCGKIEFMLVSPPGKYMCSDCRSKVNHLVEAPSQFDLFKQHFEKLEECVVRENDKIAGFNLERLMQNGKEFREFLTLLKGFPTIKLFLEMRDSRKMTGEEMVKFMTDIQDFMTELNKMLSSSLPSSLQSLVDDFENQVSVS